MEQSEPMPCLVHSRLALVVAIYCIWNARHTPCEDVATIRGIVCCWVLDLLAIAVVVCDCRGEGAVSARKSI